MADEGEQGRFGANSFGKSKVARENFKTVEKSAGLGGGTVAFAVVSLAVALSAGAWAGGFVAWGSRGGSPDTETASAPSNDSGFRSSVASACNAGWKDDRLNRDQIHCWLTRNVLRLCDARERTALVDRLVDYEAAKERMNGRLAVAGLKMAFNPNVISMGMASARSNDSRLSTEQRQAELEKTMALAQNVNAPANDVLEDSSNETSAGVTIKDFAVLAEAGYLIRSDFPDPMPGLAEKGFAAAAPAHAHPCKRP